MKLVKAVLIATAVASIAGCLTVADVPTLKEDQLFTGGRYAELETHLENKTKGRQTSTYELYLLCQAYSNLKRYSKLFPCVDQMEQRIKAGDVQSLGAAIKAPIPPRLRAEALIDFGDYKRAVEEARRAYALSMRDMKTRRIAPLGTLALALALSGDHAQAEAYARQLESMEIESSDYSINKQLGAARVYMLLGQCQKALALAQEGLGFSFGRFSLDLVARAGGAVGQNDSFFVKYTLPLEFIKSHCLYETDRFGEAKAGYDQLLNAPQIQAIGSIYWLILFDRERIAEKEGDLKGAVGYYRKAVDVIEQQRSTINTEASKIGFVGDKQSVYRQLVAALYADQQYAAAFEYVERSKSRALVDMLAAKQDFAVTSGDPAKVRSLLAMVSQAEVETLIQDATTEKPQTRSLAIKARQQLNAESPELASLVNVSFLTAPEIQALIPADEALIEYYYDAPDLIVFVLTAKGLSAVQLDSRDLLDNVRQFRKQLDSDESTNYLELSRRLYSQLIAPVTGQIKVSKLIVVAHGPLHYLPFNALHDGHSYLIERYSLRMLPSASVLKYLRNQPVVKPGNVLAFGNPDLGDSRFDLAYAQAEAIAVTQNRPQSRVLLRKDANETAFRQYGGGFRYIHFATHGAFNAESPLKSALLLAKDANSDGLLTVDKLYSLKLDADLVTLSACETGLGKIANGDDVVGLTRGFLYAGSRSIVASLWKVDDLATSYLMTRFYDNLKGGDKPEALRQAQMATLGKYPHPFYWAAFQITGNAK